MRRLSLLIATILAGSAIASAQPAECTFPQAEEAGCACTLAVDPGETGPIAELGDITGDVMVTSQAGFQAGFTPVSDVLDLYAGDAVAIPADGSAVLTFGPNCRRPLGPNTSVVIRRQEGCACAAVFGLDDVPVTTGATEDEQANARAAITFGTTLALTTALLLALDLDGQPVSP